MILSQTPHEVLIATDDPLPHLRYRSGGTGLLLCPDQALRYPEQNPEPAGQILGPADQILGLVDQILEDLEIDQTLEGQDPILEVPELILGVQRTGQTLGDLLQTGLSLQPGFLCTETDLHPCPGLEARCQV